MAIRIQELALNLEQDESALKSVAANALGLEPEQITALSIVRKAVDARRKNNIQHVYTVDISCLDEPVVLQANSQLKNRLSIPVEKTQPHLLINRPTRVLVVGMGPAGLFSALSLAEAGADVVLIDRGQPVEQRWVDIRKFWQGGGLEPDSNVQFGEGGAGTFSDGKLTCRLTHPATRSVLKRLVTFGAPPEIQIQSKPHIGSDRLRGVLVNLRKHLLSLGVEIRFATKLTGYETRDGVIVSGIVNGSEAITCDQMILATGHSARDTYTMLSDHGMMLETKPFAVGLRVEHPQALINKIQYGVEKHPRLPAADYRLAWNDPVSGRGVYSFCMCPGGSIVNASSEEGGLVVNGMSDFARNQPCANSALVVSVTPDDFDGDDPLAGIRFQQHWERQAFQAGGNNWNAPAQSLHDFMGLSGGGLTSSCKPGIESADLKTCLPDFVSTLIQQALPVFNQKMKGFVSRETVLVGVETRTSSPVRMVRNSMREAVTVQGLYPVGEGAGYAGGIMSAALDGISVAESIIEQVNQI